MFLYRSVLLDNCVPDSRFDRHPQMWTIVNDAEPPSDQILQQLRGHSYSDGLELMLYDLCLLLSSPMTVRMVFCSAEVLTRCVDGYGR